MEDFRENLFAINPRLLFLDLSQKTNGTLPIIGVGGIHSKEDAMEKLAAGATLIQLYTGFIYEGPPLIKDIKRAIISHRKDS